MDMQEDASTNRPATRAGCPARNEPRNYEELAAELDELAMVPTCRCGARASRRCARVQCRKCRSRDRWHRRQDGARRHQRGGQ
jgi:hypothetical protein